MKKIFICYRTADEPYAAVLIDQILTPHFGSDVVFRASRSIDVGEDFEEKIFEAIRTAGVLLVVIGPQWLDAMGDNGRRLDDPNDMVRREIVTAFEHNVRVVPVLMNTRRLRADELPDELSRLAVCQDVRVNFRNSEYDLPALVERLRRVVEATDQGTGPEIGEPVTRSFLVVDVEHTGARTNQDTVTRRRALRTIVHEALTTAKIAPDEVVTEDRGDRLVVMADAELVNVLDSAVENLVTALGRYNLSAGAHDWLRLRIAAHRGLVHHDDHGWSGADLAEACDLLDVPRVSTVLERAHRAQCVLVVPDSVYRGLIVHGYGNFDASAYAELAGAVGWIRVPGYPIPPVDSQPEAGFSDTGSAAPPSLPVGTNVGNMFLHNDIKQIDASNRYEARP